MKQSERKRAILLLKVGMGKIENFGQEFVPYGTRFLGASYSDEFIINGQSVKQSRPRNEFCYGYDGLYHELQLLHVYETEAGMKYAATEISNGVFAYWEIIG